MIFHQGAGRASTAEKVYLETPAADGPVCAGRGHSGVIQIDCQIRYLTIVTTTGLLEQPCLYAPYL